MKALENQSLSKYTTVRIGGIARRMLIPESVEELIEVIREESPKHFIGGGSNLLIADHEFDLVVNLREFNSTFGFQGNGIFKVGASVRLQQLINKVNEAGYGGIEYLYSVPGLVGGAIVMNAGRGKKYNQTISDYILAVDVLRDGQLITLQKEACRFSHRDSAFKNSNDLIVGCTFSFPPMDIAESEKKKKERIELCKQVQDASKPNFGTVFRESNPKIMNYAQKKKLGSKVHFSGKTANWILNEGGSFEDAMAAIKKVEFLHKISFKKCSREVIVWE